MRSSALPIAGVVLLPLLGVASWLAATGRVRFATKPETYGTIYVNSPEIYTRERLVNDRFKQDEWLERQLKATDDQDFSPNARRSRAVSTTFNAHGRAGEDSAAAAGGAPGAASPATPASSSAPPLKQSPIDVFRDRLAYRDELRSETIENQLDDRHDIAGNTLYRLKFDSTIIPQNNTSAYGVVRVRVSSVFPPGLPPRPEHSPFNERAEWVRSQYADGQKLPRLNKLYLAWIAQSQTNIAGAFLSTRKDVWNFLKVPSESLKESDELRDFLATLQHYESAQRLAPGGKSAPAGSKETDHAAEKAGASTSASAIAPLIMAALTRIADRLPNTAGEDKSHRLETVFTQRYADWFVWSDKGRALARRYARYATLESDDAGNISLKPKRDSEPYFADSEDLKKMSDALSTLKSRDDKLPPREVVELDGIETGREGAPAKLVKLPGWIHRNVGFVEFLETLAGSSNHAYTYSVTPKQAVQRVSSSLSSADDAALALAAALPGKASVSSAMQGSYRALQQVDAIEQEPLIVSFSNAPEAREAHFGWLLGPRFILPSDPNEPVTFAQRPVQYALSAIISAPSWWTAAWISIDVYWRESDGTCRDFAGQKRSCDAPDPSTSAPGPAPSSSAQPGAAIVPGDAREFEVQLPGDGQRVAGVLLSTDEAKEPEIFDVDMPLHRLTTGQDASIVIPGARLWRSTRVTLGGQGAEHITVMPDMNGLIAEFKAIPTPPGLAPPKEDGKPCVADSPNCPTLTVWTSTGQDSVTGRVVLYPPSETPVQPAVKAGTVAPK